MPYAYVITTITFIVLVICVIAYAVYIRKQKTQENFENETRECTVYYLDNLDTQKESCDAGLLNEHPLVLQDMLDNLDPNNPAHEAQIQKIQVALEAPRTTDMKACKFTFAGWNENSSDPYKRGDVENDPRGPPSHWAFCYRPSASFDPATFVPSSATQMYNGTVDNGRSYRMDFKSLEYDTIRQAFCTQATTPLPENFPTQNTPGLIRININPSDGIIREVKFVVNDGNGSLITYANDRQEHMEKTIYRQLFDIVLENKNLVVKPKNKQLRLYRMKFDTCGSIVDNSPEPKFINFATLVTQLNLMAEINPTIMSGIADHLLQYAGSLQSINNRINELTSEKNQLELDIATLTQTIQNADRSYVFSQGLRKRSYPISYEAWHSSNYWVPNANVYTSAGLLAFKNTVKQQAGQNFTNNIVNQIGWGPTNANDRRWYEYEGYVYLNAGVHQFKLNSDDAGEMFLSPVPYREGMSDEAMTPTTLVSTYFGMHGMGNQGAVVYDFTVPEGQQGYYKMLIHWFEWHGGDGYHVYYAFNRGQYTVANNNMFFYATSVSTATEEASRATKESQLAALQPDIQSLKQLRIDITSSIRAKSYNAMTKMLNKELPNVLPISYMSNDGSFYLWPGDLGIPLRPNAVATSDAQYVSEGIMDVSGQALETDPFIVDLQKPPEYTVMMWIKVHKRSDHWRRIFLHGENNSTDRTPGVWITHNQNNLNDGKVRVHFRHRALSCTSPSNQIGGGDWNCGMDLNSGVLPSFGEWFHFAVTIRTVPQYNASEIKLYYNGQLRKEARLHDNNKFEWNMLYGKKLFIGNTINDGPLHIQKAKWFSVAKTAQDVLSEYQAGYVSGGPTPYPVPPNVPNSLSALFQNVMDAQTYYMRIGNVTHSVYVEPASASNGNQKWLLIMNYNRNAYDPRGPLIRRNMDHAFPQGLGKLDNEWGQVPKEILNQINFSSVRMYATSNTGKIMHFSTRHPNVINYIKTGTGMFPITQPNWYNLLSSHNSSLPASATHAWWNQGDYALNNAPFYVHGVRHWEAGHSVIRWEVDDYPNDNRNATVHSVWIGL